MNRWECVLDGEGQVALIAGEAGIGKSRLVQRFHEQIAGTPHTWVEAAAAPFYQNTPFYPVSEMLRQLMWQQTFDRLGDYLRELQIKDKKDGRENALRGDQPADEQLAQLQSGLMLAGLKPAEAIPLIVPLLNLPIPPKYLPSPLLPEQQRRRLLATLVEWLMGAARTQPLVIIIEDLHPRCSLPGASELPKREMPDCLYMGGALAHCLKGLGLLATPVPRFLVGAAELHGDGRLGLLRPRAPAPTIQFRPAALLSSRVRKFRAGSCDRRPQHQGRPHSRSAAS